MNRRPRSKPAPLAAPSALMLALEGRAWFEWGSLALAWRWLQKAPAGDGHPVERRAEPFALDEAPRTLARGL